MDEIRDIHICKKTHIHLNYLARDDKCIYKKILKKRAIQFNANIDTGIENKYDSPVFDILRIAIIFDVYQLVMNFSSEVIFIAKLSGKLLYGIEHGK